MKPLPPLKVCEHFQQQCWANMLGERFGRTSWANTLGENIWRNSWATMLIGNSGQRVLGKLFGKNLGRQILAETLFFQGSSKTIIKPLLTCLADFPNPGTLIISFLSSEAVHWYHRMKK